VCLRKGENNQTPNGAEPGASEASGRRSGLNSLPSRKRETLFSNEKQVYMWELRRLEICVKKKFSLYL